MINEEINRPYPPTAQIAMQQGDICANNIIALIKGQPTEEFTPDIKGSICSLGSDDGIGVAFGKKLTGKKAALMKKVVDNRSLFLIGGVGLTLKKGKFNILELINSKSTRSIRNLAINYVDSSFYKHKFPLPPSIKNLIITQNTLPERQYSENISIHNFKTLENIFFGFDIPSHVDWEIRDIEFIFGKYKLREACYIHFLPNKLHLCMPFTSIRRE